MPRGDSLPPGIPGEQALLESAQGAAPMEVPIECSIGFDDCIYGLPLGCVNVIVGVDIFHPVFSGASKSQVVHNVDVLGSDRYDLFDWFRASSDAGFSRITKHSSQRTLSKMVSPASQRIHCISGLLGKPLDLTHNGMGSFGGIALVECVVGRFAYNRRPGQSTALEEAICLPKMLERLPEHGRLQGAPWPWLRP